MFAAGLLPNGAGIPISQVFKTTLYTGNATARTVTTGVDADLVWIKNRSAAYPFLMFDTERGNHVAQLSQSYNAVYQETPFERSELHGFAAAFDFSATGFTLGAAAAANESPYAYITSGPKLNDTAVTYVSWSFANRARFFYVVSWTGNGAGARAISHSLGITPGVIIACARDDRLVPPQVWHSSLTAGNMLDLGTSVAQASNAYNVTAASSSTFTVATALNTNGNRYIAYIFAQDETSSGIVRATTYTGNGSTNGPTVTLGWRPQFLLIKRINGVGEWVVIDSARGLAAGADALLFPSNSADYNPPAETSDDYVDPTGGGFTVKSASNNVNASSNAYLCLAVRA